MTFLHEQHPRHVRSSGHSLMSWNSCASPNIDGQHKDRVEIYYLCPLRFVFRKCFMFIVKNFISMCFICECSTKNSNACTMNEWTNGCVVKGMLMSAYRWAFVAGDINDYEAIRQSSIFALMLLMDGLLFIFMVFIKRILFWSKITLF